MYAISNSETLDAANIDVAKAFVLAEDLLSAWQSGNDDDPSDLVQSKPVIFYTSLTLIIIVTSNQ